MIDLTDGVAAARIDPHDGGRVTRWAVDGHELIIRAGDAAEAHGCYVMVPWAGRVRDGRTTLLGRELQLTPPAHHPQALHGTGYVSPWSVALAEGARCRLVLDLSDPAAVDAGWPFGGQVSHEVEVDGPTLRMRLSVSADAGPLPLVVGWHPWFPRTLSGPDGPVEGTVEIAAGRMHLRDAAGIPTGTLVPPGPRPWDDCLVELTGRPRVVWPRVGAVVVDSPLDHWVVYDGHPRGLCIEPQSGPPDAFNLDAHEVLPAGTTRTTTATLTWTPALR